MLFKFTYYENSAATAVSWNSDQENILLFWWGNILSLTGKKKQADF